MADKVVLRDREWKLFVNKAVSRLKNKDKLLSRFGKIHGFQDIIQHFKEEKGPRARWPKRSTSTQERYGRIGSGKAKAPRGTSRAAFNPTNKLLQQTGNLRQSLVPTRGDVRRVNRDTVALFTRVKYAGTHEFGQGRIPERSFMWLSKKAMDKILDGMLKKVLER